MKQKKEIRQRALVYLHEKRIIQKKYNILKVLKRYSDKRKKQKVNFVDREIQALKLYAFNL